MLIVAKIMPTIPLMVGAFPLGVLSPSSIVEDSRIGELGSSIRTSGVSALLSAFEGEDWKNIGDDEGTAASPLSRLEARGVACDFSSAALGVGLLVWS